jgi:hypothetical protein
MFGIDESEIRKIVRDEIKKALAKETEYRLKRVYDEQGNLIETDYTWSPNSGHIVHLITRHINDEMKMCVAHSRTHENWEEMRDKGQEIEASDRKFNEDNVFPKRSPVPPGFSLTSAGVLMPEKTFDHSR